MPPRKKIVKKIIPARRTSTRRSTASVDADEEQPVLPETEVDTHVSVETPASVDQKSDASAVPCPEAQMAIPPPEEGKDSVLVGIPVPGRGQKEEDTSFLETPVSVHQKSEAAFVGSSGVGMPAPPQEEEENNRVFSRTQADACEGKEKGTDTTSVETPLSVDQKSGAAVVGLDEAKAPPPPQDAAMVEPTRTAGASDGGVGSGEKPAGPKKVVKMVKKVTRRVVVKKKPKIVNKDEEKREAATFEGGPVVEDKEFKPKSSSDAMVLGEEVGVEMDKECKPTTCLDNKVAQVERSMSWENKDRDASTLEVGLEIEVQKEFKPVSNGDVSVENVEARNGEAENATRATSSTENPMEQEHETEVEELPVIANNDDSKMVVEDNENEKDAPSDAFVGEEEAEMSKRQHRRKEEIFIGGLHRDAKEEDIRNVFGKIGEIIEVRLMMDGTTGKNKGYAFLRYSTEALAKKAVSELAKVEVCGKLCGTAALEDNDTILLDNIDKKWKKTDLIGILREIGIEKIDTVTVASDPSNVELNRGFAFLELQTNRDAQIAFKKLQKKDAFGKGLNIKVSWTATPDDEPNKDDMQKVKSVYLESVPTSWDEKKIRDCFEKFGEIERVVLSRNIPASKRKDYAFVNYTTQEAALSCTESFDKDEILENGSKVDIRVSLAKPSQKRKSNKDVPRDKLKTVQRDPRESTTSRASPFKVGYRGTSGDNYPFRGQASWRQEYMAYNRGPPVQNYPFVVGEKRPYSSLGGPGVRSDPRGYPRARIDGPFSAVSHSTMPSNVTGPPYYQPPNAGYGSGTFYGATNSSSAFQARYDNGPYGSSRYPRY